MARRILKLRRTLIVSANAARLLQNSEGDRIRLVRMHDGRFRITHCGLDLADALGSAESFIARYRNALDQLAK